MAVIPLKIERNLETICADPTHGLTIYQVSAQLDVNCRGELSGNESFYDGRTDGWMDSWTYGHTDASVIT